MISKKCINDFFKEFIIILRRKQLYAKIIDIKLKKLQTFFYVKISIIFISRLKIIKNTLRFSYLFIH